MRPGGGNLARLIVGLALLAPTPGLRAQEPRRLTLNPAEARPLSAPAPQWVPVHPAPASGGTGSAHPIQPIQLTAGQLPPGIPATTTGLHLISTSAVDRPQPGPPVPNGGTSTTSNWNAAAPHPSSSASSSGHMIRAEPRPIRPTGESGDPPGAVPISAPRPAPTTALQIEKIGPDAINVGEKLAYDIVVRNASGVSAADVRVEDRLPGGARYLGANPRPEVRGDQLSWNVGTLEPGAERRFHVEVQPSGEAELSSQATASFSFATSAALRTRITRPQLTLVKNGPEQVLVGDPATFRIQVTNTGSGPATNVVLRDQLPPGLQHAQGSVIEADIGTLGPGETKTVTLTTTAALTGKQVNEATVTADGGLQATARATVMVLQPVLALRKTGPQERFLGREVEFDLEVGNNGTAPAVNVRVIDTLPEGVEFQSATASGVYEPSTRRVTWLLGTLGPGERRGLAVKSIARKAGDWVNQAVAQADRIPDARSDAPLHIEGVPALMLEVVDLEDPVEVGNESTYEIRVVNQGTSVCTNVIIAAVVPDALAPLDGQGATSARVLGQQVIFEPLVRLAARADALYRVRVRGVKPGDVRFRVQMRCDQLTQPVIEEEGTRVYSD